MEVIGRRTIGTFGFLRISGRIGAYGISGATGTDQRDGRAEAGSSIDDHEVCVRGIEHFARDFAKMIT
jgi:hypothetical protein